MNLLKRLFGPRIQPENDRDHDPDHADGRVLPVQVGLGSFLNGACNRLHALVAGAGAENGAAGENAVGHRQQTADNDKNKHLLIPVLFLGDDCD